MSFSNQTIDVNLLSISTIELEPLSRTYRKLNLILSASIHFIIIASVTLVRFQPVFELPQGFKDYFIWVICTLITLAILELAYHWFADQVKAYALREHDIHYRSGLFFRKHVSQPLLRVQHIEIKRGPLERKAGLATLQVYSAGGAMQTFFIPGLPYENAIRLRSYILGHEDLTLDE